MCSNNIDIEDMLSKVHVPSGCGPEIMDDDVQTVTKDTNEIDPDKLSGFMQDFVTTPIITNI